MSTLAEVVMRLKGDTPYAELTRKCGLSYYKLSRIATGIETNPDWLDIVSLAHKGFRMSWKSMLARVDDEMQVLSPYIVSQSSTPIGNGKQQRLTVEIYPNGNP